MALFKKKADSDVEKSPKWAPDPRKAGAWFKAARTTHDTQNYEFAMQQWLLGLKFHPASMDGLEGFLKSATAFAVENAKGPGKEVAKAISGKEPSTKYVEALLEHGTKPTDTSRAVRAFETAIKLDLPESAYALGERAMEVAKYDKKARKDTFVKLMALFGDLGVFDKATKCGEIAVQMDPGDGALATRVRNMSAEATMSRGGFTGEQGGFAKNIRNLEAQQKLGEEDRIAKDSSTHESLIARAKADYESRPNDIAAAEGYVRRLLERGGERDEALAKKTALDAFAATGKTTFKVTAGDITLRVAKRKFNAYKADSEKHPGDEDRKKKFLAAQVQLTQMELKEFEWRVSEFPSDNGYKLELARRMVTLGPLKADYYEQAIPLLQKSKSEVKLRPRSLRLLADSFAAVGYVDEAIESLREAISLHGDPSDGQGLDMQYSLVALLRRQAEENRDVAAVEEADSIASKIMRQDFGYRDIKQVREQLKGLIAELRG
ncbi:MAG: hypothetical protein AAF108_05820 [Planctomycetota bacterium]